MAPSDVSITRSALKTPRAAAVAGIVFALLYGGSVLMIRLSVPVDLEADIKMAGVLMMSLGTIWLHTQIMHRPIVIVTYGLALLLLVVIAFSAWITLVFPAWVLIVSVYILIRHPYADENNHLIGADETAG